MLTAGQLRGAIPASACAAHSNAQPSPRLRKFSHRLSGLGVCMGSRAGQHPGGMGGHTGQQTLILFCRVGCVRINGDKIATLSEFPLRLRGKRLMPSLCG